MADDLKYGYKGAEPTQSFGNNTGVFDPNDINNLIADNKWTTFGQLELIETQSYSGTVTSVNFLSIQESTYNVHFMTFNNIQTTTNTNMLLQFYENGVLETANVYHWAREYNQNNGSFGDQYSTTFSGIQICNTISPDTNETGQGYAYIYNAGDSSKYTFCSFQDVVIKDGIFTSTFGSALLPQTSTVDGFQVTASMSSFDISLYGIRYS